jgi:tetratricopeptide (TPR) repeat protein
MRELEEDQRWDELERLANRVLADLNITSRTTAVAHYFAGRAVLYRAPADAVLHFREAQRQLAKFGERGLAAEAIDWEAGALYLIQDPAAIDVGRRALVRYRMLHDRDPRVESRMLEHIATYLLQRREYVEAVALYRQALNVASKVLDLTRMANIYHGLAEGCLQAGDMRQAMNYMERAVNFYRSDQEVRGPVSPNLARAENDYACHLMRNGYPLARAEEMVRASIEHFAEVGSESGRGMAMRTMGELRQLQNQLDEAIDWTSQGVEIAESLGETVSVASGYQQLGELWAMSGDYDRFEASFTRAMEVLDRAGLPERRAEALARYRRVRSGAGEQQLGS